MTLTRNYYPKLFLDTYAPAHTMLTAENERGF